MEYLLEDLIDIPLLQTLQNKLNTIYSFPSAIIDNNGKILTAVAWQDICTKFHRVHPDCEKECIKSDQYILSHLQDASPAVSYQCPHGLTDNAAPIVIDGQHLGNFFTGQFFLEKPDVEFFKNQAKKYGFDETAYLEALNSVPIWTREKLGNYLDFIKGFIEIIAGIGLNRLKEIEAHRAIKESEERYRAIVQSTSDWIWEIDKQGKYTYCSERVERILGYTPAEIIGRMPFDLMPNEERERVANIFQEIRTNKASLVDLENWNLHKNGNRVCLVTNGHPVLDENGEIIGYRGADKDITERKLAEEKVREKDIQFRKLSANVPDLIYQFTRRPDGSYCVPIASEGIINIFGCSPEDVIDDFGPIASVIFPEDATRVINDIEYSAKHLNYFTCEFRVQIPGKAIQWIYSRSTPEKLPDGSITWFGFNVDITSRKIAEEELVVAKEKAEESDRLKSAFLANMSHEIRTPMNGILGFAELLKEPNLTGDEQQQYIRIIEKSGLRMLNIIHDIVDMAKIESGQMEVSIEETNINRQIEFIYEFFKPEAEKKGIQLDVNSTLLTTEVLINTDPEKIYAILTNLVKNAIKNTHEGTIEIGYTFKSEYLEFFVKDTGTGIPPGRLEAIFQRFIQADISNRNAHDGAGLGLSIAKAYVELLGGKIWVESVYGKGSTFYFTILCNVELNKQKVASFHEAGHYEHHPNTMMKILVAEDDETSELLFAVMFKKFNFDILYAKTGVEAVKTCRENPDLDIVLMDIRMPDMNGYEATRQIRLFNKEVIIIAQTAFGMTNDRGKAITAGCNEYISKPVNMDKLMAMIQKLRTDC